MSDICDLLLSDLVISFRPLGVGSQLIVDDLADFNKNQPKNFIFESYSSGIGLIAMKFYRRNYKKFKINTLCDKAILAYVIGKSCCVIQQLTQKFLCVWTTSDRWPNMSTCWFFFSESIKASIEPSIFLDTSKVKYFMENFMENP